MSLEKIKTTSIENKKPNWLSRTVEASRSLFRGLVSSSSERMERERDELPPSVEDVIASYEKSYKNDRSEGRFTFQSCVEIRHQEQEETTMPFRHFVIAGHIARDTGGMAGKLDRIVYEDIAIHVKIMRTDDPAMADVVETKDIREHSETTRAPIPGPFEVANIDIAKLLQAEIVRDRKDYEMYTFALGNQKHSVRFESGDLVKEKSASISPGVLYSAKTWSGETSEIIGFASISPPLTVEERVLRSRESFRSERVQFRISLPSQHVTFLWFQGMQETAQVSESSSHIAEGQPPANTDFHEGQ